MSSAGTQHSVKHADLVIQNGTVYRGGGQWDEASVAIAGSSILACGTASEVEGLVDGGTEIIDLRGGSLLPGLQDAHVHPLFAGVALLGIDLSRVHSRKGYAELITDYVRSHPEETVFTGAGWYGDAYAGGFPVRFELDALVSDRPVILDSHDAHGVWVNSRALELAGIDDDTPDPVGGRILRDSSGQASGILLDTARSLIEKLLPKHDEDFLARAMLAAQERLHSVGVTAWQDALVGTSDLGQDAFPVYRHLVRHGLLSARVGTALWWDRERGLEQIPELLARRADADEFGGITANTVKIMQDGMVENHTASLLAPYTSEPPTNDSGISLIDPKMLNEAARELDDRGFQIHLHAVGDRAVRECLDAVEFARNANGPSNGRHQIAHLDLVDPADVPRFAALDVAANVQMLWARRDKEILERKLPLIGSAREPIHFPFGSLLRAGARLVAGSDWPVSDPNPLWAIHTGVTRLATKEDVHAVGDQATTVPLEASESIGYADALDAYTSGAAWANHLDHLTGIVRPGMAADLVVLDADISSGDNLGSAQVLRTLIDGRTVYEK